MSKDTWKLTPIWSSIKTEFQEIKFYETEDKKLVLTLDTFIQYIEGSDEEGVYHKALLKVPFLDKPEAKDYLICGGGDGLLARNIFKFNPSANITLVDIDRKVVDLHMRNSRLLALNDYSLFNCKIYYEDILKWIPFNKNNKYEVILLDLPDANNDVLKKLYSKDFLVEVTKLLSDKGIISIQTHLDITNSTKKIIKEILGNIKAINYSTPLFGEGIIVTGRK